MRPVLTPRYWDKQEREAVAKRAQVPGSPVNLWDIRKTCSPALSVQLFHLHYLVYEISGIY